MTELLSAYVPTDSAGKARIIFVHGLAGHVQHTWMSNKKKTETLWPKWVGEATGCPVWLLGYVAPKTRWFGDAMSLPQLAIALLETLCSQPSFLDGDEPIVLVGHSLGGLVIKLAIKLAFTQGVGRHERMARKVKGVVFVGTPHFGSVFASIVAWCHFARPNPQMRNLGLHDEYLATLNTEFRNIVSRHKLNTLTFVETEPMRLPWVGRFFPGVTIVTPTSSEPNLAGEVGIPIQAHHLSICKPKNTSAPIHNSLLRFIEQVAVTHAPGESSKRTREVTSPAMEAFLPGSRKDTETHLAFAIFGDEPDAVSPVCISACIVTDTPDRLRQELLSLWKSIQADPLVDAKAKERAPNASLTELLLDSGTRDAVLRGLATISFSAYLYYCENRTVRSMSKTDRVFQFVVSPLTHRLSKRGEKVVQFHTRVLDFDKYLSTALSDVKSAFHRDVSIPVRGKNRFYLLEELASLVAFSSGEHLGDVSNAERAKVFQSLRTRIRYAENVATKERHTRDKNPLP